MADKGKYYIPVEGELVEVEENVYVIYYRMGRRERYIEERDQENGVVPTMLWIRIVVQERCCLAKVQPRVWRSLRWPMSFGLSCTDVLQFFPVQSEN